jgi:DNA-directed RNA polymerase specialized sigma24 family protein
MGSFLDDLAELVEDAAVRRLAVRRTRSRELAEDALQDTFRAVAQTSNPEAIEDLRAFFCKSLIHTINRQFTLSVPIPAEDIGAIADSRRGHSSSGPSPPACVASEVNLHLLVEAALIRLERDRAELMAMVPARSDDPFRYRYMIIAATRTILRLLFEGPVTMPDWNAVLRSEYPQWCDEPGLAHDAMYQRLGRARADVKFLLRAIMPRERFAS